MYKIFVEKRCIAICSPTELPPYEHLQTDTEIKQIEIDKDDDITPEYFLRVFETSPSLTSILIADDNVGEMYKRICKGFKEVPAAGGLVRNKRDEYLLIYRKGMWDLPKGHHEDGEDIKTTAIREVREETGIKDPAIVDLICITDHCYMKEGIWHLKHVWWYDMTYNTESELVPQEEEGISRAIWVPRDSLDDILTNTYPSITEVFTKALALMEAK